MTFDKSFPLNIKEKGYIYEESEEKKLDPNAIDLKLDALIQHVHGSLESKPKMIDDFNEANPECSKNSIEKKIRECFVKDKRDQDPRQRYYATDEFLTQQGFIAGTEKYEEIVEMA